MGTLRNEYRRKDTFMKKWGALFILLAFFIFSWGGQFITQMQVVKQEAEQHQQEFVMSEYWPQFWASTFENWQSEWLQLATQALLISGLATYIFRTEQEEIYKTQLMIEELREELTKKKK